MEGLLSETVNHIFADKGIFMGPDPSVLTSYSRIRAVRNGGSIASTLASCRYLQFADARKTKWKSVPEETINPSSYPWYGVIDGMA
jgi:hypothetical protein